MKLILNRTYFNDATIGNISIEGLDNPVWYTIEKPWLDNKPYISCIPEGEYTIKPYSSNNYHDVWQVMDVKDRTKILIHIGNWQHDLLGCIAVGAAAGYLKYTGTKHSDFTGKTLKAVSSSGKALSEMREFLNYPSEHKLIVRS